MKTLLITYQDEITYQRADNAVMAICGLKYHGILHDLTLLQGKERYESAMAARDLILKDYAFNSFREDGIQYLATVLMFICQQVED